MHFQSSILLCGIVSPWLATATLQSSLVPTFDTRSPRIDINIPLVSIDKKLPLRILPLGDSLTWGRLSSDGNGYRLDLLNLLWQNPVEYVGSQRSGNMTGNHNEGHPGAVISQIEEYATTTMNEPPNVVLLMAGTLDIVNEVDPSNAPGRLGHLIDEVVKAFPRAAVLVAEIPPIGDADANSRATTFNTAIARIMSTRVDEGRRIQTVHMGGYVTVDDLQDGLHPTDRGYALMARAWYDGIKAAESRMWLAPPVVKRRGMIRKRGLSSTCSQTSTSSPIASASSISSDAMVSSISSPSSVFSISSATLTPSAKPLTTYTSTRTINFTVTKSRTTATHTLNSTTVHRVLTSTTNTRTSTSSSTSVPTLAPTFTPTPFLNETTSVVTIPTFSTPASISVPSGSAPPTSPSGTSLSTPTSDASRFTVNLSWMAAGLVSFWLSGMV